MRIGTVTVLVAISIVVSSEAKAEQCVSAVRALLPWTAAIKPASGYAKDWKTAGEKAGFPVDKSSSGCSDSNPCVLVYQPSYSRSINQTAGHVAVYYGGSKILDSNGICGGFRKTCTKKPDFSKAVHVIHPKKKKK